MHRNIQSVVSLLVLSVAAFLSATGCSNDRAYAHGPISGRIAGSAPPADGKWKDLGTYRITGYCPCAKCCGKSDGITADGTYALGCADRIVAAPKSFAFGTQVWIDGVGVVVVHDRGSAIQGRRLELFFKRHQDALQWGVQERRIFVRVE
jgi:3D (Asp-Asp-Asp) domain-containing protein